jgi:indole-3-acetate monooxygenase
LKDGIDTALAKAHRMNYVIETGRASNDPLARARSVVPLLLEAAPRIEAARELPPDVVEAMHRARLFRTMLPHCVGGDTLDLRTHGEMIETVAMADASAAWVLSQGLGCAMAAAFLPPASAKRLFGPDNAVLAWGAGIQGKAVAVDGGYRITGKWAFASGSRHATLLGGHSYVYEADGTTPRQHPDGSKMDRTALFARSKATVYDVWDVVGLRGTGSDTFEVNDLFVPEDETIDRADQSALNDPSPIFRVPTSLVYAIGFAGLQLGVARAVMEALRELAIKKTPRGASSVLRESPVFQTQLAQFEARLRSARAYLLATADEVYANVSQCETISLEDRIAIRLAATHCINEGVAITTDVYRAAGATAIFPSNPFERRLRDALTASQQVQGRIDHYQTVGRWLLDLDPGSNIFL